METIDKKGDSVGGLQYPFTFRGDRVENALPVCFQL